MNRTLCWTIALVIGTSLAVSVTGCGKRNQGPPQRPPLSVTMVPAIKIDTPIILDTFGNTKDRVSVNVMPQVSGLLVETFIEDGAVVTNGQPLFLIDPSDYAIRVQQAEGVVAADRSALELSRLTLERNTPLLKKELISTEVFDTIKTRVDAAEAQMTVDEASLEKAKLDLSRCTITAAVSGVCSMRYVDNGNLIAAGQTPLTNIRSYDPMYVDFSISERYLTRARNALADESSVKIEVRPRDTTNWFTGTLRFIDNAVDPMTGTIMLRGEVPNPDLKLWSQQFVDVRIVAGIEKDAIMVPESAIQMGKHGEYLFVAKQDGTADMRPVQTGVRDNDLIQILGGVEAGEQVIVLGQLMLYPGASVVDMSKMAQQAPGGPPAGGSEDDGAEADTQ